MQSRSYWDGADIVKIHFNNKPVYQCCLKLKCTWWRHQMIMFSALLALCAGNSPVTGKFPSQRPTTGSFDVFFDLRLNKRLSKLSRRRWFESPSRSLWCHCNDLGVIPSRYTAAMPVCQDPSIRDTYTFVCEWFNENEYGRALRQKKITRKDKGIICLYWWTFQERLKQ